MDNNALLLLEGAKKAKQTIGVQGEIGFGGGLYGGDPADLEAIGLSPMPNNDDPTNENYGSYQHTSGSVMLFIPAFCYRIGGSSAPSYSRDGDNALEIRDASLGEGNGWILHRAFIDGGKEKSGFFIDKYLCSKDSTGELAISVKNGNPIITASSYTDINSSPMPGCVGAVYDAITLSKARGEAYACVSVFQWSAIAMLSLAHGQAAKSTKECAWFDSSYQTNFPKGNNNGLVDIDDSSVTFTSIGNREETSLTGSASNLAKTTHTGQIWGITDINGNKWQPLLGWKNPSSKLIMLAKESVRMHDFTKDNRHDTSMFDTVSIETGYGQYSFGGTSAFYKDSSGTGRAMCGVHPKTHLSVDTPLFGKDGVYVSYGSEHVAATSGVSGSGKRAGVWSRFFDRVSWTQDTAYVSFRAAGYAK